MSSPILANAASINPPIIGKDIVNIASSTNSAVVKIPDAWRLQWVTIEADGCKVYYAFTMSPSESIDETSVSTVDATTKEPTLPDDACLPIPDGQARGVDCSKYLPLEKPLYMVHKESAGSAYVRLSRSSGQCDKDI